MFQRLKGAIDSRIAEEQARQRLSQASPSRSASNAGRSTSRNLSPSKKASRQSARGRQDGDPSSKGPDPADFEPELVIDDDDYSRSGTPRPPTNDESIITGEKTAQETSRGESSQESGEATTSVEEPRVSSDLPTDVRVKLRKLEKLESRYHELLRSYRVAHARVLTIEPFEISLRENTPLTSISDPKALVEYLNQVNLKGDMVLDELKRVSNERDIFKHRLSDAEKSTKEAWNEVANLRSSKEPIGDDEEERKEANSSLPEDEAAVAQEPTDGDSLDATATTPPDSFKSPTISARGMSLFSPKSKPTESAKFRQGSEDLFSYDDEVPRLETELKDQQNKINGLEIVVKSLKGDLAVTRESTQSMVQTLEESTRELSGLRDVKDRSVADLEEQKLASERLSKQLRADMQAAMDELRTLQTEQNSRDSDRCTELEGQLQVARQGLLDAQSANKLNVDATSKVEELQADVGRLESETSELRLESKQNEKMVDTLNKLVATLRSQLTEAEEKNQDLEVVIEKSSKASEDIQSKIEQLEAPPDTANQAKIVTPPNNNKREVSTPASQTTTNEFVNTQELSNVTKKKNKKKKIGKSSADQGLEIQSAQKPEPGTIATGAKEPMQSDTLSRLQDELRQLRSLLEEKDAAIERIHGKLKDQDGLREEIDTLRDDLINVGQEHVEAKDRVKELIAEKAALEAMVTELGNEIADVRGAQASIATGSEQKHKDLTAQFDDLKVKALTLQTDLSAAQQLASSRFKDLNDLRNILQKAQPEINALRSEAAEVKSVKEALAKKDAEFKRLDSRHEEMRSEMTGLKKVISDRESEIRSLKQKISQESNSKLKAEESSSKATQELQRLDTERRQATESLDRLSKELTKAREDLFSCRSRLKDLEQQFSKTRSEGESLKEEIDLKTAQYASAQSLMASMRDQTGEMAMQLKEARERCESLDEEVAEAHRLLGERSREGETMRRLLTDVEGRADTRIREMKERMDSAIEERDRAEDEASTAGRRRARELEDLRNKNRDMERNLKRAEEDMEELELAQRDWKRRREELEHRAGQSSKEVEDVRTAMGELRDALDESERQARDLEKQKAELRRSVEDTQHRLEKLQKSHKSMADEITKIQTAKTKPTESGAQSSRSSQDSGQRLGSPAPKSRPPPGALIDAPNGQPPGAMDYVYLKNVLLQFLEQKDKKHQMQLIPVLGMLLRFDRKDEQRWMSAITTKS